MTGPQSWAVVVLSLVAIVAALTYAGWSYNDRPMDDCVARHGVCVQTTDGWKPYAH